MKNCLFYFCIFNCLFSCHVPISVQEETSGKAIHQAKPTVILPIAPIYDTTEVAIKVVHNPKFPTIYGVMLTCIDTIKSLKIQKIVLNKVEKIYPDTCTNPPYILGDLSERCLIKRSDASKFSMESPYFNSFEAIPKCIVYYKIDNLSKFNYTNSIETISCKIDRVSGEQEIIGKKNVECIWSVGRHQ